MSDIFDISQMTEEDIKLQYITPVLTSKWDIKKITMETSPVYYLHLHQKAQRGEL